MRPSLEVHPQAHCLSCEGACHSVPSPLVGEGQGEGYNNSAASLLESAINNGAQPSFSSPCTSLALGARRHPSPCPSPTRGEGTLWHCSAQPQPAFACRRR